MAYMLWMRAHVYAVRCADRVLFMPAWPCMSMRQLHADFQMNSAAEYSENIIQLDARMHEMVSRPTQGRSSR